MIEKINTSGNVISIELTLDTCDYCGVMVVRDNRLNIIRKIGATIIKQEHHTEIEGNVICIDCAKSKDLRVKCALCQEMVLIDLIKERFGGYEEFLCQHCYETVPAKVWQDKKDELSTTYEYY